MRRHRKSYAQELREQLGGGNNNAAAPTPAASITNGVVIPKPNNGVVQRQGNGLASLIAQSQKKVEAEMPPLTFEESFRGKQDSLIGILRMLVYEADFTAMVSNGQINQATFDQLKAAALQTYKMWPKEIYAAMLQYQKARMAAGK